MDHAQLTPLAGILIDSYLGTASYSRHFRDEYGQPPTTAAKAHHLRSIAQAQAHGHDRYDLDPSYVEFGRLALKDNETGHDYLVRSEGAITIEAGFHQREALFPTARYIASPVNLVAYKFHREGLDLSITGTKGVIGRRRLAADGVPVYIATWPYFHSSATPPGGDSTFDQGIGSDPWPELGGMENFEERGDAE